MVVDVFCFLKFGMHMYLDGLLINLYFVWCYPIEYAYNGPIIDFSSFVIYSAIILDRIFKLAASEPTWKFCNLDIFIFYRQD